MTKLNALFRSRDRVSELGIPAHRMDRLMQSLRRRLSDQVAEVLDRACTEQDLRTATGLYAVLEDICNRRQLEHGRERRVSDQMLASASKALGRCREFVERNDRAPDRAPPHLVNAE